MDAPRLDQETVERLLGGSADGPQALARLLDAVRVPAGAGEVIGEAAAVAAFREARAGAVGPARPAGRTPRAARPSGGSGPGDRRRAVPRDDAGQRPGRRFAGLGGKLAVAAVIASFGGGVALAATGNLPGPTGDRTPADAASGRPVAGLPPTPHRGGQAADPVPSGTDPPTPARLCTAYHRLAEPERGRALRTPAFAGLVAAAGSPGRVPGYCADLSSTSGTSGPDGAHAPGGSGPPGPDGSGPPGPAGSGPPGSEAAGPAGSGPPQATATGGSARTPGPADPPTGRRAR